MNKLSKLADFYTEEYVHARSILLRRPKRLTSIGKHSHFKQVYRAATLEKEEKKVREQSLIEPKKMLKSFQTRKGQPHLAD